jgi:hypothetical protein
MLAQRKMHLTHMKSSKVFYLSYIAIVIIFSLLHYFSYQGLNLNVIDEAYYIMGIKDGLGATIYPAPLFFKVSDFLCNGNNIVYCMRNFNLFILINTSFLLLLICKKILNYRDTLLVVSIFFVCGISWYTNMVMPEVLTAFLIYLLILFLISVKSLNWINLVILGLLNVLIIGVKNHGVFLVPIISFYLYISIEKNKIFKTLIYTLSLIIFKISIDYFFYGESHIFGKVYNQQLGYLKLDDIPYLIKNLGISTTGNLLLPLAFFILPITIIYQSFDKIKNNTIYLRFLVLLGGIVFSLIFATILFTYLVANNNSSELINRIHERYYSFGVPLLFLCSFFLMERYAIRKQTAVFIFYILLNLLILFIYNNYYLPSYVDNPDLLYYLLFSWKFIIFIIFQIILYFYRRNLLLIFYSFSFYFIVVSVISGYQSFLFRMPDTPYDYAGKYICKNISSEISLNLYVEDFVSYGFLYYHCPRKYNVKYFSEFDLMQEKNTFYVGHFPYKNQQYFQNMKKITDAIYYNE